VSEALSSIVSALDATAPLLPGAQIPWMQTLRSNARTQLDRFGLPTQRQEDWKYTSVRPIERRSFSLLDAQQAQSAITAEQQADLASRGCGVQAGCTLVFLDGRFHQSFGEVPDGLVLRGLADVLNTDPALAEKLLGAAVGADAIGFAAMNGAHLADGAVVVVEPGTTIEAPINLVFAASTQENTASLPRNLIHLGDSAHAQIVEHYTALDDSVHFTNTVTEILLGRAAHLQHTKLQEENSKSFHVCAIEVRQGADSFFASHALSLGAALSRHDINTHFDGPGGTCEMNGLYLGVARQHMDFHTRIYHAHPNCTSRQHYKGILDDHARGVFNGQVHVLPDAQKSDAEQSNHNLLLSKNAEIDTKPQLEINADDVKCAHGTTVGQLDDTMLFYLRSRGIPDPQARGLLTYGFAHDVVERVPLSSLREYLEHVLVEILPYGDEIKELI
jgi:Fe-S cluster assembly protein SufD